ncbi:MAG: class I SAM-dependent methyltransferase [Chromatiales bacterium]|nr:class I SAM-dependent methyltransferase [Chromatiales bacterium]
MKTMSIFFTTALLAAGPALAGGHSEDAGARLAAVLAAQPAEVQARFPARNPRETLEFFGVRPGMTVVEALPGAGWYTRILLDYLGSDGTLIGADYAVDMYPLFGFFSEEAIKAKETWTEDWPAEASGWGSGDSAQVDAFQLGSLPKRLHGSADVVLMVRALHNLARFQDQGGFLYAALADASRVLRPGGVLGIVQHEARPDMPDDWASGAAGYLKRASVIEAVEAAGFEFVGASEINQNPADNPGTGDTVWRLPPNFVTARGNEEVRAQMSAIGESNRMTLKFRKPE